MTNAARFDDKRDVFGNCLALLHFSFAWFSPSSHSRLVRFTQFDFILMKVFENLKRGQRTNVIISVMSINLVPLVRENIRRCITVTNGRQRQIQANLMLRPMLLVLFRRNDKTESIENNVRDVRHDLKCMQVIFLL